MVLIVENQGGLGGDFHGGTAEGIEPVLIDNPVLADHDVLTHRDFDTHRLLIGIEYHDNIPPLVTPGPFL